MYTFEFRIIFQTQFKQTNKDHIFTSYFEALFYFPDHGAIGLVANHETIYSVSIYTNKIKDKI